jgi:hypothetical protein
MLTAFFPPNVMSGGPVRARAVLTLVNRTTESIDGQATVRLSLSTDASLEAGDTQVLELTTTLRLRAGGVKRLTIPVSQLPPMPDGVFRLVAELVRPDGGTDLLSAAIPVNVAEGRVELRTTTAAAASRAARAGRFASVRLSVENRGNVAARGLASVTLRIPGGRTLATAVPARMNLAPGRSGTLRVRFAVPADLPPGTYDVVADLAGGSITGAVVPVESASIAVGPLTVM